MDIQEIEDNLSWLYKNKYSKEIIIAMLISTLCCDVKQPQFVIDYLINTYKEK